ncbi:uncharacterized protein LOC115390444 [Salarias fasciatus]|uniref:uncharacterized protein LOC115390444 n=1 Tax=Salarias fasciatus TaxID=181472 RepID=UPI0011769BE1|nr:uncharacterized protein LOC115390444 [Salarias fasciatus]
MSPRFPLLAAPGTAAPAVQQTAVGSRCRGIPGGCSGASEARRPQAEPRSACARPGAPRPPPDATVGCRRGPLGSARPGPAPAGASGAGPRRWRSGCHRNWFSVLRKPEVADGVFPRRSEFVLVKVGRSDGRSPRAGRRSPGGPGAPSGFLGVPEDVDCRNGDDLSGLQAPHFPRRRHAGEPGLLHGADPVRHRPDPGVRRVRTATGRALAEGAGLPAEAGKKSTKQMWESMAEKVGQRFQENFLPERVQRKWFTLVEGGYKRVKDGGGPQGRGPVRFKFYRR